MPVDAPGTAMRVDTDNSEFALQVLPATAVRDDWRAPASRPPGPVIGAMLGSPTESWHCAGAFPGWNHLLLAGDAATSQCGRLTALARAGVPIPDRTACVARTGTGFTGFKGRNWSAAPGNVQLAVHLAPRRPVECFATAFTVLAALSVLDAIDAQPGLGRRPGIRWLNDIVLEDAKVAGVLAFTQTLGREVTSVVLGIGLNVETTPEVVPTCFVPSVTSIREATTPDQPVSLRPVLDRLLAALLENYGTLLGAGYRPLLERYRERSTMVGRDCTLCTDESDHEPAVVARGRLLAIGDGLELYLAGHDGPFRRGRLMAGPSADMARH